MSVSFTLISFMFTDNDYSVIHMAHKIDKFAYKFCCGMTIGGVLGMKKDQFIKINGYSNEYYVSIIFPLCNISFYLLNKQ